MFKRRISMEFYFFAKFLSLLRFFLQNRDIDRSTICFEFISDSSTRNLDREEHLFFHQCSTIPVEKINEVKKGGKKSGNTFIETMINPCKIRGERLESSNTQLRETNSSHFHPQPPPPISFINPFYICSHFTLLQTCNLARSNFPLDENTINSRLSNSISSVVGIILKQIEHAYHLEGAKKFTSRANHPV